MGDYDTECKAPAPTYAGPSYGTTHTTSATPFKPLAQCQQTQSAAPRPPALTWTPITQEAALHAIVSSSDSWDVQRARLTALILQLSPADASELRQRLDRADIADPVASVLTPPHRAEMLALLAQPQRAPAANSAPAVLDTEVRLREALIILDMDGVMAALAVMDTAHR